MVKPKPAAQKTKGSAIRKTGGQKGHQKHERTPFPQEQVDRFVDIPLAVCPTCGGVLNECEEITVKQQIKMVEKPCIVTEYHGHPYTGTECQRKHRASAPKETGSGLFSTGLIAPAAYLKGRCHISFRALQGFFQEVLEKVISCGFLVKPIKEASGALERAHKELGEKLKGAGHIHVDERGWKERGEKRWIGESRGEVVLEEILGKGFKGIITWDF
jgi:transposase